MRKQVGSIIAIYEPTVELINHTTINRKSLDRFFDSIKINPDVFDYNMINSDTQFESFVQMITEFAARMCYQSWDKGRPHKEHIRHLAEVGHWSVFEHNIFTFALAGISRTLSHELVRHRHLSFSQLSQRYVDHTKWNLGFVVPPDLIEWFKDNPLAEEEWAEKRHNELQEYSNNLTISSGSEKHIKRRRQAARNCLPGCMETRMVVSGNARAWLEACIKRCPPNTTIDTTPSDLEIYRLFDRIKKAILENYFPDMWEQVYKDNK